MLLSECCICRRAPQGFGWLDPTREASPDNLKKSFRRFCSRLCLHIYQKQQRQGIAVMRNTLEQQAADAVIAHLADYVVEIGLEKSMGSYTEHEILGLIDTVLDTYHDTLQMLYKDEVPF